MSLYKETINFILPIPPTILMRKGDFPNCINVFEMLSGNDATISNAEAIGRLFTRLCRLTGLAWLIWSINSFFFVSGALLFISYWGGWIGSDIEEPLYLNQQLSGMHIISMIIAIVFVCSLMFNAARGYSLSLCDRCLKYVQDKTVVRKTSRKRSSKTTK